MQILCKEQDAMERTGFGVVVVELINCKYGGIVRNKIWQE